MTQAPGQLHSFPGGTTNWMFLNVREPPFDDLDVRRAINLATDRARLVTIGGGPELADADVPVRARAASPDTSRTARTRPAPRAGRGWSAPDLPRARALIARSGRAGARVVVVGAGLPASASGEYFTRLLRRLGFRSSLRLLEVLRLLRAGRDPRGSRPQIGFFGWALDYLSAASFIQPTFTCEAVAGRSEHERGAVLRPRGSIAS